MTAKVKSTPAPVSVTEVGHKHGRGWVWKNPKILNSESTEWQPHIAY